MPINADKPLKWKEDIQASVDQFNEWFMRFAPKAFREARVKTTADVEASLRLTNDLVAIDPATLAANPQILPTLRMATCPPLARDRLVGLAYTSKNLVFTLEAGAVPRRMVPAVLQDHLGRITDIISKMLDRDIFPWLAAGTRPTKVERHRASTIVADRLCSSAVEEIVRNSRKDYQRPILSVFLDSLGYREGEAMFDALMSDSAAGRYAFDVAVPLALGEDPFLSVDAMVFPFDAEERAIGFLLDFTSSQDIRESQYVARQAAKKRNILKMNYSYCLDYALILSGTYDSRALGILAAEGIDWVWQHRLAQLTEVL